MGNRKVDALCFVLFAASLMLLSGGSAQGRFRFQTDFSGSAEFNDNIYSSSLAPVSDRIWTYSPSVTFSEVKGDGSTYATFRYSKRDYIKQIDQNRETYTTAISAQRALSRRTTASVYETLNYVPEVTTQSVNFAPVFTEAGIISRLVIRKETAQMLDNSVGGALQHKLARHTTLSFDGSITSRTFDIDAFDDSVESRAAVTLELRPNMRDTVRLSASRRFYTYGKNLSETTTDTLSASWESRICGRFHGRLSLAFVDDTQDNLAAGSTTGNMSTQIKAGGTYDIDANTRFTGNVGLSFLERTGDVGSSEDKRSAAPLFDFIIQRTFVRSSASLNLRRTFNSGYASGFDTTYVGLDYAYQLSRRAGFSVGLSRSVSLSSDEIAVNSDTTTVYIRFNYALDRRTTFSIVYSGADQTSTGQASSNITQNIVIFSIDILDLTRRQP